MKKIIYLLLSMFVLTTIATGCSVEEVGPSGDVEYKPVFSFRLDGKDRVTNRVKMNWIGDTSLEVIADIRDKHSDYKKIQVKIVFSNLKKGNYPWSRNQGDNVWSTMSYTAPDGTVFSSDKTPIDATNSSFAIIDAISTERGYFSGQFEYKLYKSKVESMELSQGRFYYVPYGLSEGK